MRCSKTLSLSKKSYFSKIKGIVLDKAKIANLDIDIDEVILSDVIDKWCEEVKKIENSNASIEYVSAFRVSGFLTFWIRKLKPFNIKKYTKEEIEKQIFVNEIFAVVIGLILLYGLKKERRKINKGAFYRLLTSLRYNSMSPNSVALIYEYLYE